MSNVPHELSEEFPSQIDLIGKLTAEDPGFAELAEEYARLNLRVHQADSYERPMEELAEHQLKKRRAFLKDEINRRLAEA
ncbi:YdcH family protein [Tropicimonas marinistellae]|uniref:YdcH family protein n=1 Tax=Tropicimonas marinistellae TaxID=1739787 RepID=UPI000833F3D9|nr:DUF465 domain-containing protein [Tropicimonas marinistellae]